MRGIWTESRSWEKVESLYTAVICDGLYLGRNLGGLLHFQHRAVGSAAFGFYLLEHNFRDGSMTMSLCVFTSGGACWSPD